MKRSMILYLVAILAGLAQCGRAQVVEFVSDSVRADFRQRLSRCAPAAVLWIASNRTAQIVDPELCQAARLLSSTNEGDRIDGERWFARSPVESGILLSITGMCGSAARDGLQWLSTNASELSVGVLLNLYDRTVAASNGVYMGGGLYECIQITQSNVIAALRHVFGQELAKSSSGGLEKYPSSLVALSVLQYARDKWNSRLHCGLDRVDAERSWNSLIEWLEGRAKSSIQRIDLTSISGWPRQLAEIRHAEFLTLKKNVNACSVASASTTDQVLPHLPASTPG